MKTPFLAIIFLIFVFVPHFQPAQAAPNQVLTDIKIIHASALPEELNPSVVDSNLSAYLMELKSIFKYTSYKVLKNQTFSLKFDQQGLINLPGNRTLLIVPLGADGKRIRYQIHIRKNNRLIFQTQVMLKNNSSITIGGPELDSGVLLINISGALQQP